MVHCLCMWLRASAYIYASSNWAATSDLPEVRGSIGRYTLPRAHDTTISTEITHVLHRLCGMSRQSSGDGCFYLL